MIEFDMNGARKSINVRLPGVLPAVRTEVMKYGSELIEKIRQNGNCLVLPGLEIRLADAFGFCDGVQRAIEIAYAACHVFKDKRIWLIGEIIHNPEVNAGLDALGLLHLPWNTDGTGYDRLSSDDVVIIPAFGISVELRNMLEKRGVQLVDSTCGNVIKVWHRVHSYAQRGITSIIHGKAKHEESMATASHSRGTNACGRFLIIYSEEDVQVLAHFIRHGGNKEKFLAHFSGCYSPDFNPERDLKEIGMANQTTMLKKDTIRFQQILREAIVYRDGHAAHFHAFDTICGATQDRQQALRNLLDTAPDIMFIVGGYNSSNTSHLAQISSERLPTFFVRDSACILNSKYVLSFDITQRKEVKVPLPTVVSNPNHTLRVGITAGASCPANIIEGVIRRIAELKPKPPETIIT